MGKESHEYSRCICIPPATKGRPAFLAIEKKRGVVIRSSSELDEIKRLLGDQKVGELSKKIDAVNPKGEATTGKDGPDIFEI